MNFSTPEFWILVAFVLLVGVAGKHVFLYVTQLLDTYSQQISLRFTEATRLHDEALSLLETYRDKHAQATLQSQEILSFVEKEVEEFKKSTEQAFTDFKTQKETLLQERLALEKQEILSKLRAETVQEALKIVEKVLMQNDNVRKKLTEEAIDEVITQSVHLKKTL